MGNRKLPFGYQMRMGEIVRNEPEANTVQDIFLEYTLGASLKEIAEQMSKNGPVYDEGKSWNKNMIARILKNPKYTGAEVRSGCVMRSGCSASRLSRCMTCCSISGVDGLEHTRLSAFCAGVRSGRRCLV